jgi:predicted dehydrogenase
VGGHTRKYKFDFPQVNQQALHMDGIANSLINGVPHLNVGGEEGLRDMKIIDAIFESTKANGKRILI